MIKTTTEELNITISDTIISLNNVSKTYMQSDREFNALKEIDLNISRGEFLFITGRSGSGKSTLLNMISGIDRPTKGKIYHDGEEINLFSEDQLAQWRGETVGVIFQFFQLIPSLTIIENIMIAMEFANKIPKNERIDRAHKLLEDVDIADQANKLPSRLSGGQQQRAAIARALANNPDLLIADEPTGNLDSKTSEIIYQIFEDLVTSGKTVIIVTHDTKISHIGSRVIEISDGRILDSNAGDTNI